MNEMKIEMPLISQCTVESCSYNVNHGCHAKAITIGDLDNPGCDTYFNGHEHCTEKTRTAGVGACKVSACQHNSDFECSAATIKVGFSNENIQCLTYKTKGS